jgi:hypothetical protein
MRPDKLYTSAQHTHNPHLLLPHCMYTSGQVATPHKRHMSRPAQPPGPHLLLLNCLYPLETHSTPGMFQATHQTPEHAKPSPLAAELPVHIWAGGHTPQALLVQEITKGLQMVRLLQKYTQRYSRPAVQSSTFKQQYRVCCNSGEECVQQWKHHLHQSAASLATPLGQPRHV